MLKDQRDRGTDIATSHPLKSLGKREICLHEFSNWMSLSLQTKGKRFTGEELLSCLPHLILHSLPTYLASWFYFPSAWILKMWFPSTQHIDMGSQVLGLKVCVTTMWLCSSLNSELQVDLCLFLLSAGIKCLCHHCLTSWPTLWVALYSNFQVKFIRFPRYHLTLNIFSWI